MKIVCISDIHERQHTLQHPLPEGDVIVCAGDITFRGRHKEVKDFLDWYKALSYKHKVLIAGNHDWGFDLYPEVFEAMCDGIHYLNDSGVVLDGVKFWGSPVQPHFYDWAFNRSTHELDTRHPQIEPHWQKIPLDTDVLITHGPPKDVLDLCPNGDRVGCPVLVKYLDKIKPKLHVFGHIHHSHGSLEIDGTTYVNASICDERYEPSNKAIVIILKSV